MPTWLVCACFLPGRADHLTARRPLLREGLFHAHRQIRRTSEEDFDVIVNEGYDPRAVVDKWLRIWEERGTYAASGLTADDGDERPRSYVVSMFPYPSGDLHMGHAEVYSISDAIARYARLRGFNVFYPIGWDSFGLPAENAALKRNLDPRDWTYANIDVQVEGFRRLGTAFDWRSRLHTSDPAYYRWN